MAFLSKAKINRFISTLEDSVKTYNHSDKDSEISSTTTKNSNSSVRYKLEFNIDLSPKEHVYFYTLTKVITLPKIIDVSKMEVVNLEFNVNKLKATLDSDNKVKYKLVKTNDNIMDYPTIHATKGRAIVLGGFEQDFLYPVVRQNNEDSPISDETLNEIIKNSKTATAFLEEPEKMMLQSTNDTEEVD
ncbi:hypothetical protein [Staphylococcus equorum]|uniref:Uncharacterized protein n=1 Tax=Staphylococcus equorum TaxID=246432 RepID=A0AAP7LV38_9STAP|nr:hypothetical protein [Staphylococcus equorum]OEK58955.1 hypothetical protein ASS94_01110 [Staphylococcus equorum]